MQRKRVHFKYPWSAEVRKKYRNPFEQPFPQSEYDRRVKETRNLMKEANIDCLLIFGDVRERGFVRWMSNFYPMLGETIVVLPSDGDLALLTSASAHGEPMHSFLPTTWIEDVRCALTRQYLPPGTPTMVNLLEGVIKEKKLTEATIGTATGRHCHIGAYLWDTVTKTLPKVKWVDGTELYFNAKAVKSELEKKIIKESCRMNDIGMKAVQDAIRPGVTEVELAGLFEYTVRKEGMHTVAYLFDTRVVSGERAGFKNVLPTSKKLQKGDMVFVDVSDTYFGYAADGAFSTSVGKPNQEQDSMLETAVLMNEAMTKATKPGVKCCDLAEVARKVAIENGQEDNFIDYMAGHGMGTSQVEKPNINPSSEEPLLPNMYFSLEPMLVKTGFGTGTAESSIWVTGTGSERMMKFELRPWLKA